MSRLPLINYTFSGGAVRNKDGGQPGQMYNAQHAGINISLPDWGVLTDALSFRGGGSHLSVPMQTALRATTSFAVEMAIRVASLGEDRMNLFQGSMPACSLNLRLNSSGYSLRGGLNTPSSWQGIQTELPVVMPNAWVSVALVQTGDELVIFLNSRAVARRAFSPAILVPLAESDFTVACMPDGKTFQFIGDVAGLRVWGEVPPHLETPLLEAERIGLGNVESKYLDLQGPAGPLGVVTGSEQQVARGRMRSFAGGDVFWAPETGTHVVQGPVLAHYRKHGGPTGELGFPASDEQDRPALGARVSYFENGAIFWNEKDGAHEVHGEIFTRYVYLDAAKGPLGLPTSDELISPRGRRNEFKGGTIFWSTETGASALSGDILNCYRYQLQGTKGPLGMPISGVNDLLTPEGNVTGSKVARFENGSIYQGRKTGACAVQGDIRRVYEESGGPWGSLGFPKTNEKDVPGTDIRYNDFENGIIIWRPRTGARALTALQLHLGMVRSGYVNDGINVFPLPSEDHSAELMVYTTVTVNGQARETDRQHGRHHGTSYDINTNYDVTSISSATTVDFKIRVKDYDSDSTDDYLCTIEKRFDINNVWGIDNPLNGVYIGEQPTDRGEAAPRADSVLFDYRIGPPSETISPDEPFRKRAWWNFDNVGTPTLSRRTYANTFRDVQFTANTWEQFMHPFDSIFYLWPYRGIAKGGNCFGNSLEAQFALSGRSVFAEPIKQYSDFNAVAPVINIRQGYQLGAEHIHWIISNLAFPNLGLIFPTVVYKRVRRVLERHDTMLLSFQRIDTFEGHTVLAYAFEDGKNGAPDKIFVADPNVWEFEASKPDPSWVEIRGDGTFYFNDKYRSRAFLGLLPYCFFLDSPCRLFTSQPRTPFWEIAALLAIGALIIFGGDAETVELKGDGADYYKYTGTQRGVVAGAIPGFSRIPLFDADPRSGELYAQRGYPTHKFEMTVRGKQTPGGSKRFQYAMRTRRNSLALDSPIAANSNDHISLTGTRSSAPLLETTTEEAAKVGRVTYSVLLDDHGREARAIEADLGMARGATARIGASPRAAAGFVIENAGPMRPLNLTFTTVENNQARRSVLRLGADSANRVLRIRPQDWLSPHNTLVVERLESLDGGVLNRTIERVQAQG